MRKAGSSSRSHHGCQRCKAKKVKCDETRPACLACQRAGVGCSGYGPRIRWSRKHERWPRQFQCTENDGEGIAVQTLSALTAVGEPAEMQQQIIASSASAEIPLEAEQHNPEIPWMSYWDNQLMAGSEFGHWMNLPLHLHEAPMELLGYQDLYPPFEPNNITHQDMSFFHGLGESGFERSECADGPFTDPARSTTPTETAEVVRGGGLLETFYRLSVPTSIPRFSDEYLIRYYLDNICPLISCFDSHLNPFRTLVGEMWPRSRTIYFAIQSMATAHLTNHYPYMERFGLAKRSQAWKSLQLDLRRYRAGKTPLDELLMSLLLIGPSSVWYQRSNLGLQYLFIARNLMQSYLQSCRNQRARHIALKNENFIQDALMHWEMSASFVEPVAMMPFPGYGMPILQVRKEQGPIVPHAWTGIATELTFAMAEVGRILRRRLSRSKINVQSHQEDLNDNADEQWARALEDSLWSYDTPRLDDVMDLEDVDTPKSDLIKAASAMRQAGLLELYVAFPQIHKDRMAVADEAVGTQALAMSMLEIAESVNISSGACRLLPLVLLSAAGQLRLPEDTTDQDEIEEDFKQDEIIEARWYVESKFLSLSRKYPQNHALRMLEIATQTWERLDDSDSHAHWLAVIHDKALQTLLG